MRLTLNKAEIRKLKNQILSMLNLKFGFLNENI